MTVVYNLYGLIRYALYVFGGEEWTLADPDMYLIVFMAAAVIMFQLHESNSIKTAIGGLVQKIFRKNT